MENSEFELKIWQYFQNQLSEIEKLEIENLIKNSEEKKMIFEEIRQVYAHMDLKAVPEIDSSLKANFQAMLHTFELEQENNRLFSLKNLRLKIQNVFNYRSKYSWAYSLFLIAFGAFGGYVITKPQQKNIESLTYEVNEIKQVLMLNMLENPTATERIKAVSYTQELQKVDEKVIDALLATLNNDPNDNVRLATLDALSKLTYFPKVREELVNAMINQDSQLVQLAMAEIMLKLQEKKSIKSFNKFLENKEIDNIVKKKIEQTVQKLEVI